MNITVTITDIGNPDEHHDALLSVVEAANVNIRAENVRREAAVPPQSPLPEFTDKTYLENVLNRAVASYAKQAYETALARLGTAAAQLTYAERLALIEQVEQQLV